MKQSLLKTTAIGLIMLFAAGLCYPQTAVGNRVLLAYNRPNPTIIRIKIKKILKKKKAARKALQKKKQLNQIPQAGRKP